MEQLITQHIVKTQNMGVSENLFGGDMLRWIDEAGAIFAMSLVAKHIAKPRVVTKAMDGIEFNTPMKVGSIIAIYGSIEKIGTTSLTVKLTVKNVYTNTEVVTAKITFVNMNEMGQKAPHGITDKD